MKSHTTCPVDGCHRRRGLDKLVCYACWRKVPRELGRRLYVAWNNGDETDDYPAVRDEVLTLSTDRSARSMSVCRAGWTRRRR